MLTWTAYGLPGLRIARHRAVAGDARRRRGPGGPAQGPRAPAGRDAGAAASPRVSRRLLRRGASASWRRPRLAGSVRSDRPASRASCRRRRGRFPSPFRAQVWFEWRQQGRVLPALVGILLPFELGLLYLARHEPPVLVELTLAGRAAHPALPGRLHRRDRRPAGSGWGRFLRRDAHGHAAAHERGARRRQAAGGDLEHALRRGCWSSSPSRSPSPCRAPGRWSSTGSIELVEIVGTPRAIVIALLGLTGLWPRPGSSSCRACASASAAAHGSSGRACWFACRCSSSSGPSATGRSTNGTVAIAALWDTWPWILAVPWFASSCPPPAGSLSRLHRSRLLSDRRLVAGAALWSAVVLALYGVLVWLFCTPEIIPRSLAALVAILAVPLARLSAAPLALAWSRHRGAQTHLDPGSRRAPRQRTRVMRSVRALIGVPLALVLVEAVSFEVRNRNNGRSSRRARSASTCCMFPPATTPRSRRRSSSACTAARGGRPLQKETSQWNTLAESQGFIVVYPSGVGGDGPRTWRMDRGAGLAEGRPVHLGPDRHPGGVLQHRPDAGLRGRALQWRRHGIRALLHAVRPDRGRRDGGVGSTAAVRLVHGSASRFR